MPKIEEWGFNSPLKMLIHGETGSGKTYLAATAALVPDMRPVLFFDCESGRMSAYNVPGISQDNITFFSVEGPKDIEMIEQLVDKPERFKTIIVDSLTEMYSVLLNSYIAAQGRARAMPQLQDYGLISKRIMDFLRGNVRTSPAHFIATAGTAMDKDEDVGAIHFSPDILGKLNVRAGRMFDIVGYLVSEVSSKSGIISVGRTLQVQPYKRVRAKDRSGKLGDKVEDPSMITIYNAVYGKEKEKKEKGVS